MLTEPPTSLHTRRRRFSVLASLAGVLTAALASALVAGCGLTPTFRDDTALLQHHPNSVPQISVDSKRRIHRVLYHALTGRHHGRDYDLAAIGDAGFTAIHYWEGQRFADVMPNAQAAGLAVIPHNPSDADITSPLAKTGVLGWYLDEEPSFLAKPEEQDGLRAAFQKRYTAIKRLDPNHPVFLIDGPPARRVLDQWKKWAVLGDISVHDNYAVHMKLEHLTNPARHVAHSVRLARDLNPPDKPLWFVIQAFSAEARGWYMPTPRQYRAMAMAALLHGATGLVTFALDSFVTRDDGVIGIAPWAVADYGDAPDYNNDKKDPARSDIVERAISVGMWQAVATFNHVLAGVETILLQPTAAPALTVSSDNNDDLNTPIRVLAKRKDGALYLFVLNLADEPVTARFRFDCKTASAPWRRIANTWPFEQDRLRPAKDRACMAWQDRLDALGVRVYRLDPASD
jgi:hypothetical protein